VLRKTWRVTPLRSYTTGAPPLPPIALRKGESAQAVAEAYCEAHGLDVAVGRCKLKPVAHRVGSAWFQRRKQTLINRFESDVSRWGGASGTHLNPV
jgi:hypothetical protein